MKIFYQHLAVLVVINGLTLGAQDLRPGRLEGVIAEKNPSRSASAALISLLRDSITVDIRPGADGRFQIDSLPVGRYQVLVTSPLLDSLELAIPEREVVIANGQTSHFDYTLPFGAALRDAVCPGLSLGPGKGVVAGRAIDADTEQPIAGANIVVSWSELVVDPSTLRSTTEERVATVKSGLRGNYRLCGVPTGTWLSLQLQVADFGGTIVRTTLSDEEGAVVHFLSLSVKTAPTIVALDSIERAAQTAGIDSTTGELLQTGNARITGTVRGADGLPLAGAQVHVRDARGIAVTDVQGRFALNALPDGTQILVVRHLGYALAETSVGLRSGQSAVRDVSLARVVSLDSVVVSAYRTRYREFDFNRGVNFMVGNFLTAEMIARRKLPETGDLVDRMPGFNVVGHGPAAKVFTNKALMSRSGCQANVVVDGVEEMGVNDVPPSQVQGIETYVSKPKPSIYRRDGCGLVVIWTTKWRRPTRAPALSVAADSALVGSP